MSLDHFRLYKQEAEPSNDKFYIDKQYRPGTGQRASTLPQRITSALAVCRAHRGLPVGFLFFHLLLSPYLFFISLLYLALYVLGDDTLIS